MKSKIKLAFEECKKEKEQYELDHTDMYSIYRKQNEI